MALTQDQIAQQMIGQLRILDPSVSGEVGTPERKIIDTVAQAIAEAQVDLNLLSGALDLSTKFGSDLDAFVGLFGFGRQAGSFATGFVTFSRSTASPFNIVIPTFTQVQGNTVINGNTTVITFQTTTAVTLVAGQTSVIAPIQALLAGGTGDVAANTITQFANIGAPPLGITTVNNAVPTSNGTDVETDAELKVRFRNTVFRNLAGTEDQYMALAIATQFSTKATVLGPLSRYTEYIQVPLVNDAQPESPTATVTADATHNSVTLVNFALASGGTPEIGALITGTGIPANTTLLDIEGTTVTLSQAFTGSTATGLSFTLITGQPADSSGGGAAGHWTTTPSNNPYAKYIYTTVPYYITNGDVGANTLFYRQDTDFTLNTPPIAAGDTYRESTESPPDLPSILHLLNNPNVTFYNVYVGPDTTVTLPRPGDVVLLEYSYLSAESRNDITRNITNCVDVYVNGENPTTADAIIPPPPAAQNLFTGNPSDMFYYQHFRRIGQPDTYPVLGHVFTGLFWQPVIDLPDTIVAGTNTYLLGTHYWAVEDKTLLGNTVRTRNGIEWDPTAKGQTSGDPAGGPYTGQTIVAAAGTSLTVSGYTYDKNIVDLQTALDGSKQITTDVLAHRATRRYFKLDLTVVYSPGAGQAATNTAIEQALTTFFAGQYFGTTIQLSDLLLVVRNVFGVSNVRWSNDVLNPSDDALNILNRVTETDVNGNPRLATITATATNGSNVLSGVAVTSGIPLAGQVVTHTALPVGTRVLQMDSTVWTLDENYTGSSGSQAFTVSAAYNTDFILRDSELPMLPTGQVYGDALPGLIIRPRAQSTFNIV